METPRAPARPLLAGALALAAGGWAGSELPAVAAGAWLAAALVGLAAGLVLGAALPGSVHAQARVSAGRRARTAAV